MGEYREEFDMGHDTDNNLVRNADNDANSNWALNYEFRDEHRCDESKEEDKGEEKDLKAEYKHKGMICIIIGLVVMILWGIIYGLFAGGPVILLSIFGMRDADNLNFDAAKKKYLIAKIIAAIGGICWVLYMIVLLAICYMIQH